MVTETSKLGRRLMVVGLGMVGVGCALYLAYFAGGLWWHYTLAFGAIAASFLEGRFRD